MESNIQESKSELLTDERASEIVNNPRYTDLNETQILAAEVLEYRKIYGKLGCQWLSVPTYE